MKIYIIKNINHLPEDIVYNHIVPYTYQLQSKNLLEDIRSFLETYTIIYDFYSYEYNESIWINDLVEFIIINKINILSRNAFIQYVFEYRYENISKMMKIRFYWGLLTPFERNQYIYTYCS